MQIKKRDEIPNAIFYATGTNPANYSIVTNQGVCFLP